MKVADLNSNLPVKTRLVAGRRHLQDTLAKIQTEMEVLDFARKQFDREKETYGKAVNSEVKNTAAIELAVLRQTLALHNALLSLLREHAAEIRQQIEACRAEIAEDIQKG